MLYREWWNAYDYISITNYWITNIVPSCSKAQFNYYCIDIISYIYWMANITRWIQEVPVRNMRFYYKFYVFALLQIPSSYTTYIYIGCYRSRLRQNARKHIYRMYQVNPFLSIISMLLHKYFIHMYTICKNATNLRSTLSWINGINNLS